MSIQPLGTECNELAHSVHCKIVFINLINALQRISHAFYIDANDATESRLTAKPAINWTNQSKNNFVISAACGFFALYENFQGSDELE